jgi:hypothetical protein
VAWHACKIKKKKKKKEKVREYGGGVMIVLDLLLKTIAKSLRFEQTDRGEDRKVYH